MKIRNGFVSNSSSSSFVLFGFAVDNSILDRFDQDDPYYELEKELDKFGFDYQTGEGWYNIYIGKMIARWYDGVQEIKVFDFPITDALKDKLADFAENYLHIEDKEAKLFGGTTYG